MGKVGSEKVKVSWGNQGRLFGPEISGQSWRQRAARLKTITKDLPPSPAQHSPKYPSSYSRASPHPLSRPVFLYRARQFDLLPFNRFPRGDSRIPISTHTHSLFVCRQIGRKSLSLPGFESGSFGLGVRVLYHQTSPAQFVPLRVATSKA